MDSEYVCRVYDRVLATAKEFGSADLAVDLMTEDEVENFWLNNDWSARAAILDAADWREKREVIAGLRRELADTVSCDAGVPL